MFVSVFLSCSFQCTCAETQSLGGRQAAEAVLISVIFSAFAAFDWLRELRDADMFAIKVPDIMFLLYSLRG